jgi:hypothetical protein
MSSISLALGLLLLVSNPASAQSNDGQFRVGGQLTAVSSGEFDSDVGFGALFSWLPTRLLGLDAEVSFYPEDLGERLTVSQNRLEGLFGVTVGPSIGRLRPFAKLRPGFLAFEGAPGPFPCIAIYPPPLSCEIAAGTTVFALDLGGGLEVFPTSGLFLRLDAGDRMLRYPGPVIDGDRQVRDSAYFGHDFRFSIAAGVRF